MHMKTTVHNNVDSENISAQIICCTPEQWLKRPCPPSFFAANSAALPLRPAAFHSEVRGNAEELFPFRCAQSWRKMSCHNVQPREQGIPWQNPSELG